MNLDPCVPGSSCRTTACATTGIEMLCMMLRENTSVAYLDISNNNFGHEAMRCICRMLTEGGDSKCKLSKLVLESNNLADIQAPFRMGFWAHPVLSRNTFVCPNSIQSQPIRFEHLMWVLTRMHPCTFSDVCRISHI